jgi:glycerol-3-phosphate dehydrogenase
MPADPESTPNQPEAARAALLLAARLGWSLPICDQVVRLLDGVVDAPQAVRSLMERDLRAEVDR